MAGDRVRCPGCRNLVWPEEGPRGRLFCPRCEEPLSSRSAPPASTRNPLVIPLIVAGAVLFVGAVASGIVAVVLLWPDRKVNEPAPLLVDAGAKPAEAAPPAKLPDEAVERVKRATVYIRVTMAGPRGQVIGSGSGFLLTRDGHLITNSHVISPPPEMPGLRIRKIEVVFHSGEPNSFTADATVIRSDPGPDLALLRVLPHSLPEPVPLGDSTGLRETHDVYIFGFPLGERLGKSITVSKSSVSSLRRDRPWPEIQVNGGMHPGNSGGPVTDAHGRVVGVAVAGIVGTQLNFAIPSETVRTFLQSAVKGDPVVGGAPLPPVGDPGVGLPAVNDPPPRPAPRPPAAKVETPAGTRATQILGGTFDREYHDVGPEGSLLVGLEIGLGTFINYDVIRAVRPIYRGGGKETFGKQRGTELDCIVKVVARPGYAVGAISIKSGLGLDSLSITFMKVVDGKLDRLDTYESERIGGPGGGGPVKVGGDGSPVVGIVGKENDQHATGLGLLLGPKPKPPPEPPGVRDTAAAGGAFAREDYREVQSDGAILIGFELGLGKVFNTDIISYLRPIWLGPKGERMGMPYGKRPTAPTIVKAKEGYALAGVVVRGGGALEGICFTFMRIGKSGLDTTDAYTSEWFGEQKRKPRPSELQAGDGSKVVGIHGKRFEDRGGDRYNDGGAIGTIGLVLAPKEK